MRNELEPVTIFSILWCRDIVDDVGDHALPEPVCPLKPWCSA